MRKVVQPPGSMNKTKLLAPSNYAGFWTVKKTFKSDTFFRTIEASSVMSIIIKEQRSFSILWNVCKHKKADHSSINHDEVMIGFFLSTIILPEYLPLLKILR